MAIDKSKYFTRDEETGRAHKWSDDAIYRHIMDQVGDLSGVKSAINVLVGAGAGKDEMIEAYLESAFATYDSDVYGAAQAILTGKEFQV